MSKIDQDVDKNYVDGGVKAAENYANKEGNRKMASNLNRPAKGAGGTQAKTPGASANPNIKRGGFGVPNAPKSNIQRGGFGGVGKQLQNKVPGGKSINAAREGNFSKAARDLAEDAAKEGAKKAAVALVASPPFWIFVSFALMILFIFWLIMANTTDKAADPCTAGAVVDTLTIKEDGPQTAKIGDSLTYTITVADTQLDKDVTLIAHVPDGESLNQADIQSSWAKMTVDAAQKTITWKASENQPAAGGTAPNAAQPPANNPPTLSSPNFTFTVTLKATADNTNLVNYVEANPLRETGTSTGGGSTTGQTGTGTGCPPAGGTGSASADYVPPNDSNCGGKYQLTNVISKNFGDPGCNFDKDQLHTMLVQQDPANADIWFNKIIVCESGFNPNAFNNKGTPDPGGAWGLFQDGHSFPPGRDPSAPGQKAANGATRPFDRGDTVWPIQVSNAVNLAKGISSLGAYWACAR